jgi:hypothetical protein
MFLLFARLGVGQAVIIIPRLASLSIYYIPQDVSNFYKYQVLLNEFGLFKINFAGIIS